MCVAPANLKVKTVSDAKKIFDKMATTGYSVTSHPLHGTETAVNKQTGEFAGSLFTSGRFNYNDVRLKTTDGEVECMDINGDGNFDTCMERKPNGDIVINDEQGELVVRESSANPNEGINRFYNMTPQPQVVYGSSSQFARTKK